MAEGQPSIPSFRDVLAGSKLPITIAPCIKEGSSYKGEPALLYTPSEVDSLAAPFHLTLIGKLSHDRPNMEFIRKGFSTICFQGDYHLGLLDDSHVLIRFTQQEDYHRCWMHGTWSFRKHIMKIIKWTPHFSPEHEPPFAPVWVSLPHLPIHLFQKNPLLSVASLIGRPLKIDAATQNLSRPSVARICVEVDLLKDLPKRLWIGQGDPGFWQQITYENLLAYCEDCFRIGHASGECHIPNPQQSNPPQQKVWRPKPQEPNPIQTDLPIISGSSGIPAAEKSNIPIDIPSSSVPTQSIPPLPLPQQPPATLTIPIQPPQSLIPLNLRFPNPYLLQY